MDLALAIAKSGLEAQHRNIEIISNNLANAGTTAYKKSRAEFQDLPYDVVRQPGAAVSQDINASNGFLIGTGTKIVGNSKIFQDGQQLQTGRALDVAIKGRGFLQVQLPNGNGFAYTRTGSLTTNSQGQLTTLDGYLVQPPVTFPQGSESPNIGQDGTVTVMMQGSSTPQQLGQLQLTDFINPDGLQPIGQNLYLETAASGTATTGNPGINGLGILAGGSLESSNVNVVEEMVNLIEAQRAFEVTSKAVSAVDNMMQVLSRTS